MMTKSPRFEAFLDGKLAMHQCDGACTENMQLNVNEGESCRLCLSIVRDIY